MLYTVEEKKLVQGESLEETDAVFKKLFHHSNLTLSQESSHSHWLRNTFSSSYIREACHDHDTFAAQGSYYQSHDHFMLEKKIYKATY